MDINEITRQLKQWPQYQAGAVKDEHLERFACFLATLPEREQRFHVVRSGVGGSEIIEAIRHYVDLNPEAVDESFFGEGYFSGFSFSSPRGMASLKLMMRLPEESSDRMNMGTRLESTVIQMYLDDHGLKRRSDIEQAIKSFQSDTYPWLRGTPDLVVEHPDGRIKIVDIKVPAEVSSKIMPGYAAQLSYYRLIAEVLVANKVVPPMAWDCDLVQLDFSNAGLRILNLSEDHVQRMIPLIIESGDFFWNERIMKGELPSKPVFKKPSILDAKDQVTDEESKDFHANVLRVRVLSMIQERLERVIKEDKERLKNTLIAHPSLSEKSVKLSMRTTLNKGRISEMIEHGSVDMLDDISTKEIKDVVAFVDAVREGLPEHQRAWFDDVVNAHSHRVPKSSADIRIGLKNNDIDPDSVFNTSATLLLSDHPDELTHQALSTLSDEVSKGIDGYINQGFVQSYLNDNSVQNEELSPDV